MSKWNLFSSVFQVIVGTAAIIAYFVIAAAEGFNPKWTITLILAIAYAVLGTAGIVQWNKSKNK